MRVWHRTERWTTDGFVVEREGGSGDFDTSSYRVWRVDEGGHEHHMGWYPDLVTAMDAVERFAK